MIKNRPYSGNSICYRFETDVMNLTEIGHSDICVHAKFVLDRAIHCTSYDILELRDGQWYLVVGKEHIRLQGRWVDTR